jgi:hypothetical protein
MVSNISGFGLAVALTATSTFPAGYLVTQFADDADPLDMAAIQIADTAMGLNGDLLAWSKANPMPMVLNVVPGSLDDVALQTLADNNRVAQGKSSAGDVINAVVTYPDGRVVTRTGGVVTNSMFGNSVSSGGRLKTKSYTFMFQSGTGA